jgi:hypothetical protein
MPSIELRRFIVIFSRLPLLTVTTRCSFFYNPPLPTSNVLRVEELKITSGCGFTFLNIAT